LLSLSLIILALSNYSFCDDFLPLQAFQPSIPNLVYQYNLFTNYDATTFAKANPEIP
jgi:hypothetical protein